MTPPLNADQQKIIDRLTRGPLLCTAYRGLAPSAGALKVAIFRLRKRGVDIKTERARDQGRPGSYRIA